ncbi:hypothetical protein LAZ67_5004338 [Cordylochernes scorpioides]|uniref:Transposase IS30-like HTH domain-containing protein n=1 Tax=Cordylochernes scorpioides TaxID=51811 RepID=A0ABY6KMS3_9ARAC|nr:hypothetical protein LAZ67_5004338 [Cordylochernes scorpioides]
MIILWSWLKIWSLDIVVVHGMTNVPRSSYAGRPSRHIQGQHGSMVKDQEADHRSVHRSQEIRYQNLKEEQTESIRMAGGIVGFACSCQSPINREPPLPALEIISYVRFILIRPFQVRQLVLKKTRIMPRRKQRSSFYQVSEFDRGRIVTYRDGGLSFREIGDRVGRNQTTVMQICNRWMQEGKTDRRIRSHHLSAPLHVLTGKLCAWQ